MNGVMATTYHIDVSTAKTYEELYATISAAFGRPFPAGPYSVAWTLDEHPMPIEVTVTGSEALRQRLPTEAALFLLALRQAQDRHVAEGFVVHID